MLQMLVLIKNIHLLQFQQEKSTTWDGFLSTPHQSTYKYDFIYDMGCWGFSQILSFLIFSPSERSGAKEMDVMGTNRHRERLYQKKQEYCSCSEHLKDVQLSLLISGNLPT